MAEYIGKMSSGYYKSYVSNINGNTFYSDAKKEYCRQVDYTIDKNGTPIYMGIAYICSKSKTDCDNIKVGSLMPKKYWQYHCNWVSF